MSESDNPFSACNKVLLRFVLAYVSLLKATYMFATLPLQKTNIFLQLCICQHQFLQRKLLWCTTGRMKESNNAKNYNL